MFRRAATFIAALSLVLASTPMARVLAQDELDRDQHGRRYR
jgi:hypothetical protein